MLSFMSDRRVLSVSAALITAAIFLFLLGTYPSWRAAIRDGVSWSRSEPVGPGETGVVRTSVPQPVQPMAPDAKPATPADPARPPPVAVPPDGKKASDAGAPAEAATPPSFDIVRVEPSGDSVVAARARAGAPVVLLDEGRPIARAQADASGQVAFVPPTLKPGEHSFMLSVGEPNSPGALSTQSVAVSVQPDARTAPLVALIQPDQPTRVLSEGTAGAAVPAPGPAAAPPAAGGPPVAVSAIDVEEMGGVYATGKAPPGSHCRVYLNGSFVAPVTAGPDGKWSLKIQKGMRPGHYAVRVDQIGSADGSVQARAEVPFDYPAASGGAVSLLRPKRGTAAIRTVASGSRPSPTAGSEATPLIPSPATGSSTPGDVTAPAGQIASAGSAADAGSAEAAPTVIAQLLTTRVVHGDSLWRISRKMLGHGRRYTQIYAANTTQIRDPRLIYPGQIFVMPHGMP